MEAKRKQKSFGYRPETVSVNPPGRIDPLSKPAAGRPLDIAIGFLKQNRQRLGLAESDLLELKVTSQYKSEHSGVTHIYLRQEIGGIEVVGAEVGTNVADNGSVINLHSSFVRELRRAANRNAPLLTPERAVRAVVQHLGLTVTESLEVLDAETGPRRETTFSKGGVSLNPITVKLVYQPTAAGSVRLAWAVDLYEVSAHHLWNIRVDAATGEVLAGDDYVDHDNWGEHFAPDTERNRVAARAATAPSTLTAIAPPATVNEGSAYNVFALPLENPNDGGRTIVTNPADALASPFGWHDTNGAMGAEYTITRGNNVHAYLDLDANNAPDTGTNAEPNGGSSLQFNFPFDPLKGPELNRPSAVVNLFYWNNIIHDVFYRYGFTESSGNFQSNNYGRGGTSGDYVKAEAQDGSGTNNANFSTPADNSRFGNIPRMQMFVWNYPMPNAVVINSPSAITGSSQASFAEFGPKLTETGITRDVVQGLDASDSSGPSTTDGCSTLSNGSAVSGKIAYLDRGTCGFTVKVKNAQNAGAVAVIIGNNVAGDPFVMGGADSTITIPSVMVSLDNATFFKTHFPFNATLKRSQDAVKDRDSDFDAGVIAHEYGHGISNRLTGGPNTTSCLGNQEQMGEGWSDYIGLVMTTDPSDTATMRRGIGTYLNFETPDGNGIRPTPYSTDMTVNPSTYDTIKTAAVPHGVGYVWATMLWEMYWNLVNKHGYNPNVYGAWNTGGNNLAIQLVMDGMKLQPCSPGFVSGRDAILQADMNLTGGANQCEIWSAFAKRGLGYSATQGSTGSVTDGLQAFDLPLSCTPDTRQSQTITVTTSAPATSATNTSFTVAATASSGLPVAYSSSGACTNNGATFTTSSAAGTCVVMYDQAGNSNYKPAPQVIQSVTVQGGGVTCATITLSPSTLPGGVKSASYGPHTISAAGGTGPYTFSATGLPSSLTLSSGGVLSGTLPGKAGNYTFTITATDANNCKGSHSYTIKVAAK